MVGANVSRRKFALRSQSVFRYSCMNPRTRCDTDAGDAVRDDASREKLHREFAVLWFLRGPPGDGGEGGGLLVSLGAGTGQEVRRAGPGNRRVERHRQRAHATCMIWFVLFYF